MEPVRGSELIHLWKKTIAVFGFLYGKVDNGHLAKPHFMSVDGWPSWELFLNKRSVMNRIGGKVLPFAKRMKEEKKKSVEIGLCSFSLERLRVLFALLALRPSAPQADHPFVGLDRCFAVLSMTKSPLFHLPENDIEIYNCEW